MRLLHKILIAPSLLGLLVPLSANAGGEDHKGHNDHHDHHSNPMNMGDSYPSTMFMGKTTFVLGGVMELLILEWEQWKE